MSALRNKNFAEKVCRIAGIPGWCEKMEIWDCEPSGSPFGSHCHKVCGNKTSEHCVPRECALNPKLVFDPYKNCPNHLH